MTNAPSASLSDGTNIADSNGFDIDTVALGQLNHPDVSALHSLVDELSVFNIDNIVSLPQIIVVGEQSSGKTSVLSALSRIHLPVAPTNRTSFPTEIIFQKAAQSSLRATVCFSDDAGATPISTHALSGNDLTEVVQEAKSVCTPTGENTEFSEDTLRIEINGPELHPLKLVDLPGLFPADSPHVSQKDKETVDGVVEAYLAQANSIILLIIDTWHSTETNISLQRVKKLDPNGERTIGVITRPNIDDKAEVASQIQLVKNQDPSHSLKLGWHVIKNQDSTDDNNFDIRDEVETAFFNKLPWSSVLETDRGIDRLRTKLRTILYNHMRRNVPELMDAINTKLEASQDELERCGVERSNIKEKRSFLWDIVSDIQRLTRDALNGNYSDDFFGDLNNPTNRLRAILRGLHQAFCYVMKTKSQKYSIGPSIDDYCDPKDDEEPTIADVLADVLERYPYNLDTPPVKSRTEILDMLETLAVVNEGNGLPGSCNTRLAIQLFQELSAPWAEISRRHVEHVMSVTRKFAIVLIRYRIGGDNASPALEEFVKRHVNAFFERQQKLLWEKTNELLEPYVDGYAIPLDASFRRLVKTRRVRRTAGTLQTLLTNQKVSSKGDNAAHTQTEQAVSRGIDIRNAADGGPFATKCILDMAEAYYIMCRRTFTDNVINLAIERCLIRQLPEILKSSDVGSLDDQELEKIAAEPEVQLAQRRQLEQEIATLQEGLNQCKTWRPLEDPILDRKDLSTNRTDDTGSPKRPQDNNTSTKAGEKVTIVSDTTSVGVPRVTIQASGNASKQVVSAKSSAAEATTSPKRTSKGDSLQDSENSNSLPSGNVNNDTPNTKGKHSNLGSDSVASTPSSNQTSAASAALRTPPPTVSSNNPTGGLFGNKAPDTSKGQLGPASATSPSPVSNTTSTGRSGPSTPAKTTLSSDTLVENVSPALLSSSKPAGGLFGRTTAAASNSSSSSSSAAASTSIAFTTQSHTSFSSPVSAKDNNLPMYGSTYTGGVFNPLTALSAGSIINGKSTQHSSPQTAPVGTKSEPDAAGLFGERPAR